MDPQTNLPELVEDLEVNIDELSETLQPLLSAPLHTTASSLPLLDKAKLYTFAAYSIESLLFSTLQASGINAKEHAIFAELARLKGYFAKIKDAEERGPRENKEGRARLDVGAAQRFIKHGLAGNDRYDLQRAERLAKEKARAQIKARQINKKFDDSGEEIKSGEAAPKKRTADVSTAEEDDSDVITVQEPLAKKTRIQAADAMDVDSPTSSSGQSGSAKKKKEKGSKKALEKSLESNEEESKNETPTLHNEESELVGAQPAKKRGRKSKQKATSNDAEPAPEDTTTSRRQSKRQRKRAAEVESGEEEVIIPPPEAPRTRSEMFNSLLDGSIVEKQKQKQKGKGRGRGRGK